MSPRRSAPVCTPDLVETPMLVTRREVWIRHRRPAVVARLDDRSADAHADPAHSWLMQVSAPAKPTASRYFACVCTPLHICGVAQVNITSIVRQLSPHPLSADASSSRKSFRCRCAFVAMTIITVCSGCSLLPARAFCNPCQHRSLIQWLGLREQLFTADPALANPSRPFASSSARAGCICWAMRCCSSQGLLGRGQVRALMVTGPDVNRLSCMIASLGVQ